MFYLVRFLLRASRFLIVSIFLLLWGVVLLPAPGHTQNVVVYLVNGESEATPVDEVSKIMIQDSYLRIYLEAGGYQNYSLSMVVRYEFDFTITHAENVAENLSELVLFPNPAVKTVSVSFGLRHATHVQLQLVDIQGRAVAAQNAGMLPPGKHELQLSPPNIVQGYYLMRVITSEGIQVKPVLFTATK
jgi:hypothetical protein